MTRFGPQVQDVLDQAAELRNGRFDLSRLYANMEGWGTQATPSRTGLTMNESNSGPYAPVPEVGGVHGSMAPRGCEMPPETPSLGTCATAAKVDVWSEKPRHDFDDVQCVFGSQVMDEARHMDVFRKRALPNGGRLMKVSSASESVPRTIIEAPSYVPASASVHIRAEGFVPTLSRNAECLMSTTVA